MMYIELQVTTNFSFLQGASHPEELVERAKELGYSVLAITDRNSMAGVVRAHIAGKKRGVRIIPGVHLVLEDGPELLVYPETQTGYTSICRLLSLGNGRTEKGKCLIYKEDLRTCLEEVQVLIVPPSLNTADWTFPADFIDGVRWYKHYLSLPTYLSASCLYQGYDAKYLHQLADLAQQWDIPLVATNRVLFHDESRKPLQDILTCIRNKCTIFDAGYLISVNAERYLKEASEMSRLFRHYPDAIRRTRQIAAKALFQLDELEYVYPEEITQQDRSPDDVLESLTWTGARNHFGVNIPDSIQQQIRYEMKFIREMQYAPYFLTVYDIVRFARERGILCQGRGSAANSTICFCLGITAVDPTKFDLLFERFVSAARNEPPDIDIDFEHERREEVIQYIYQKYGRDRAAIVATVTQVHQRGAIRDVGKAMGLSLDTIQKISGAIHRMSRDWYTTEMIQDLGLNVEDRHLQQMFTLAQAYMGFPRQLGQHTGGFVISQHKLYQLCPIVPARMELRSTLEWNKDDIEALGFLKIDVLALGMLTCIRKAFDAIRTHYGKVFSLATIPQDDPAVYEMICQADTIGVFQIESRAQQSMLPRLKPRCFYDLVIEVAIVRPGPIQGDMVHPYLRRRNGEEPVDYPSPALRSILERTLGVPLFQEQAMKIAIVAAGFTPAEADELRRSMATFKAKGQVSKLQSKLISGMIANGYDQAYAERVFKQLEGFGSYGFPESHAASFAQLVYVSAWIKCHYPDVFACALLNSLPMGFYQPAQIIQDASKHGVRFLPIDVNHSHWDHQLEQRGLTYFDVRLGFRLINGMQESEATCMIQHRTKPYTSVQDLMRIGLMSKSIQQLADADAFQSIQLVRREALWQSLVQDKPLGLFSEMEIPEAKSALPTMTLSEEVVADYAQTGISLKAHPVQFLREKLQRLHVIAAIDLPKAKNGQSITVAGLVLVRQRPETAKGVWFITLEDETGYMNLILFKQVSTKFKKVILSARLLMVSGTLQREGAVIHVMVQQCYDLTSMLGSLQTKQSILTPTLFKADEMAAFSKGVHADSIGKQLLPEPRNFR
jgi:error-prone DNA polymerase